MTDVVSAKKRSEMMAGIAGKNTRPELLIRKGLHAEGFRYRLHDRNLPGKPDLVFPRHKAVILINGCFWHGHMCHLFKWPSTRAEFWKQKINDTVSRDCDNFANLERQGWRILTIWECALKGKTRLPSEIVIEAASKWLSSSTSTLQIEGRDDVTT